MPTLANSALEVFLKDPSISDILHLIWKTTLLLPAPIQISNEVSCVITVLNDLD